MSLENESKLDFESWMNTAGLVFSTQLTGEQKMKFLDHVIGLCSATEIHELSVGLPPRMYRDFITFLPTELSHILLCYFDIKTLLTACQVCRNWNSVISGNRQLWRWRCSLWGFRISEEQVEDALFYKQLFVQKSLVHWWKWSWKKVKLNGHRERVTALYYYNDKVATGADDLTVRIWCCKTGECLSIFPSQSVSAMKFDDCFLLTASYCRTATSWDVKTGDQLRCFTGHTAAVLSLDFDAQLDILATGSADGTVKLWSLSNGDLLRTLEIPDNSSTWWILSVRLFCDVNWQDHFSIVAGNREIIFSWVVNVSSATTPTFQVPFDSASIHRRLIGWKFKGSFLTVMSLTEKSCFSSDTMIETSYEFNESRLVVTKSETFPISKEVDICSYLGGGKCFSIFLATRDDETVLYITRRNVEIPPILVKFPLEYRTIRTTADSTVSLCDRQWMDGISSDIFERSFLAFTLWNDITSACILNFDSDERQSL